MKGATFSTEARYMRSGTWQLSIARLSTLSEYGSSSSPPLDRGDDRRGGSDPPPPDGLVATLDDDDDDDDARLARTPRSWRPVAKS